MVKLSGKSGKILSGVLASSTISACSASALGNSLASNSAGQQTGAGAEFISKLGKFVGNHWGKLLIGVGLIVLFYYLCKPENNIDDVDVTVDQFTKDFEVIKQAIKGKKNRNVVNLTSFDEAKTLFIDYDIDNENTGIKKICFKSSTNALEYNFFALYPGTTQIVEYEQKYGELNPGQVSTSVKLSRYREVMGRYKKALNIERLPSDDIVVDSLSINKDTSLNNFLSKETVFEIEKLNEKVSYAQFDPEALVDYKGQPQAGLNAIMNGGQNLGGNLNIAPEIISGTGEYKHKILSFDGKNGVASCINDSVADRFSISDDANIVAFYRHTTGNKFYFVNEDKYYSLGKGEEAVKNLEKEAKKKGLAFKKSHDGKLCLIEEPKQSSSGPSSTAYERFSGLVTLLKDYHKIGPEVNKAEKNPCAQGIYYEGDDGSFIRNVLNAEYYKRCCFKDPHTGEFLSCNYKLSNDGKGNIIEEIVFAPEDFEEIKFILYQDKWYKIERHSKMRDEGLNEWVDDRTTPFDGDDPWCKKAQAAFNVIKKLDPAVNAQNINNNVNLNNNFNNNYNNYGNNNLDNNFGNNGNFNGFVPINKMPVFPPQQNYGLNTNNNYGNNYGNY